MPTYIMLTRLNPDAVRSPKGLEALERDAMKRIREECPEVEWCAVNIVPNWHDRASCFRDCRLPAFPPCGESGRRNRP